MGDSQKKIKQSLFARLVLGPIKGQDGRDPDVRQGGEPKDGGQVDPADGDERRG